MLFLTLVTLIVRGAIPSWALECVVSYSESAVGTGTARVTFGDVPYCEYLGVRYGKSTAGAGRFQPPTFHEPDSSEEYSKPGNVCPQLDDINYPSNVLGSEDCLFLNVYRPMKIGNESSLYPVLVFIHGGSFTFGSANFDVHGVDLLMDNDIIVVSINYRLDVLGFLRYPKFNISGNYGLLDQLSALQWIDKYIQFFGGDPGRITLMGHSAGATSINYHMFSNQSRGLFQKAILLSGTFLMPHGFSYDPEKYADYYFGLLGISSRDDLINRSFNDLFLLNDTVRLLGTVFASMQFPCFIPTLDGAYVTEAPHQLILNRSIGIDIPLLVGTTSTEYDLLLDYVKGFFSWDVNFPNRHNITVLSHIESVVSEMAKRQSDQKEFYRQLANYANMHFPLVDFMNKTKKQTASIFQYRFEFDGKFGWYKNVFYRSGLNLSRRGVVHGDDLGYIFSPYNVQEALRQPEKFRSEWKVHREMVRSIANFVKHGNPSRDEFIWRYVSENNVVVVNSVFQNKIENESHYLQSFWKSIHNCYYYYFCAYFENFLS